MKQLTKTAGAALLICAISFNALADGRRPEFRHHEGHQGGGPGWIAPLVFLGVAGAILSASERSQAQPVYVSPPVTYVSPQPTYAIPAPAVQGPPAAPGYSWYFCKSVGQYYPYTQNCPEGWQQVAPIAR
ncbi:MAG: hypothetical protein WCK83_09560 [Burkholderiales bacterium]